MSNKPIGRAGYWREVRARAWVESKEHFSWIVPLGLGAGTFVLTWAVKGWSTAVSDFLMPSILGGVVAVVMGVAIYCINIARATATVHGEQLLTLRDYESENDNLKRQLSARRESERLSVIEESRPRLSVEFRKEHPMWWPEQRWCRIRVRNDSLTATARNVRVVAKSMTPNLLPFNALPSRLGAKGEDNSKECRISPKDEVFFDVWKWPPLYTHADPIHLGNGSLEQPNSACLWILEGEGHPGQSFELPPSTQCTLVIEVIADGVPPLPKLFMMIRRPDGASDFVECP